MQRIQKLLSSYGYCSRRKAEELIRQGRVKVNGKVVSIGESASEDDTIYVDGKAVGKQRKVYIIFNKPVGCVTALTDKRYKTVMDYIKIRERVFPVGRLDWNTSGLLLLTNDGDFANRIMHPRYEVKKSYIARIDRAMNDAQVAMIEKGIILEDGKTSAAKVIVHEPRLVEITIHEGKKRIVRRMLEKLGFNVMELKRVRIGGLELGSLKPGMWREIGREEIEKKLLNISPQ